uniref:Protein MAK10 homolog n=1 Tax=Plectus sambesii TaxID=2011161 RepID=A0A914WPD1_9BILA
MDDPPDYQGLLESAVDNTVSVECAPDIDEPWKYQWTDITAGFLSACKDLQRGELVREERFHLSEAMSAIELMDPKMDAGMIRVDRPVGFEGAVDNGSLRISAMPHDELIATMDASFSGLVTWLEGHSLAQTVFTNLCLHRPAAIKDQSLHAFCAGILRLVAMFKRIIETAAVFEEEDFNSTNFGFDMNMFSTSQAVQLLKTAEEELQKLARRQRADDENDNSSSNSNAATLAERVSDRLRFVRCLLLAVSALVPTESGVPTSKSRPNFDEADKHLRTCEQFFDVAIESIALGTQPPDDNDGDFAWLPAFEPAVNRRLLPPTFPRKTQLSSRNQAMVYLRAVVERLHTIVLALPHKIANFDATLTFLRQFSQSGSCVLSRSILQLVYLPEDDKVLGVTSIIDILTDSMSDFVSPPVLQPGSLLLENADCRQLWSDFVADCAKVFLGLVQICGHNRARQRDKLIPSLEDLSALQAE